MPSELALTFSVPIPEAPLWGKVLLAATAVALAWSMATVPLCAALVGAAALLALLMCCFARLSENAAWRWWLALLTVSIFGPLIDLLTKTPFVWLVGFVILSLALSRTYRHRTLLHDVDRLTRSTTYSWLILYTGYYLLQVFRPGTNLVANILLFRQPVIWLLSYSLVRRMLAGAPDKIGDRLRSFARVVAVSSIFAAAYGAFQFLAGEERLKSWGLLDPTSWYTIHDRGLGGVELFRISGPLRRNEDFGFFMVAAILAIVVLSIGHCGRRKLLLLAGALSVVGLLLSYSLASLMHIVMFLLAYVLLAEKRLRKPLAHALVALLILAVLINAVTGGVIRGRIEGHLLEAEDALAGGEMGGRLYSLLNWFHEIGVRSPWQNVFGTGIVSSDRSIERIGGALGSVGGPSSAEEIEGQRITRFTITDNWYANHWLDMGALGLLLLVGPLLTVLFRHVPAIRSIQDPSKRRIGLALALYVITMIPQGLLNTMFAVMPMPVIFWTIMAFIDTLASAQRKSVMVHPLPASC